MKKVRDIMTVDVATVTPDATLREIAAMMKDEDTGAIPVVDEDELLGIVTDRDIVIRCIAAGKDPSEVAAEEILSEELELVEPDADVDEAARIMSGKQIRRLPVVENGRLVGMVSLGDIAVKAGQQKAASTLEEVSQGVKPSPAGRQPARAAKPKTEVAGRKQPSPETRLAQERGERMVVSRGRRTGQEISNRGAAEEEQRQSKVVSIRHEGKTSRRRRAS